MKASSKKVHRNFKLFPKTDKALRRASKSRWANCKDDTAVLEACVAKCLQVKGELIALSPRAERLVLKKAVRENLSPMAVLEACVLAALARN